MKQYLHKNITIVLIVIGCITFIILPMVLDSYQIRLVNQILCFSLFALSFHILFSHVGLLSFGQAAYFGLGAYVTALAFVHIENLSLTMSILTGGLAGGLGAFLIGLFCVRLSGAYFALLTVAFSQFLFAIAFKWRGLTGGDDGLSVPWKSFELPIFGELSMANSQDMYYVLAVIAVVCFLICWHLTKTPLWNAVKCVKRNEERSGFIGYNPYLTKLIVFTIAGLIAGIAGSLFVLNEKFISTDVIDMNRSMICLMMSFIGGAHYLFGAAVGAGIYTLLTDFLSNYTARWELIVGCLFIVIIMFFRGGVISLLQMAKPFLIKVISYSNVKKKNP